MSYTVLARRYRSSTFDEVIGQNHVAQTLKKAIDSDRIAHAYLFCGTRGVGKTSMARILAKALNCEKAKGPTPEPCGECESCKAVARGEDMDVIEIDAASNTGVDNIRELIENSQYRPARSRFKVYIIDEVHMLSKSAFNALLKTLEEPPGHVKFILATTEPEKVLPTILSRCQRYDFRNIPTREIAGHLKDVVKREKVKADEDALLLVAKAGAGSMRDALSLLDRLLSIGEKQLTVDTIEQLLGLPKSQLLFDLAEAIGTGDVKATLSQADAIVQGGLSADSLVAALVEHLRNLLILRTCGPDTTLVEVPGLSTDDLVNQAARFDPVALTQDIALLEELRRHMRQSQSGRALLDATLVRMAMSEQFASVGDLLARLDGGGDGGSSGRAAAPRAAAAARPPAAAPAPAQKKKADEPVSVPAAAAAAVVEPEPAPAVVETAADDDGDDDLPRPGKVWSGPSLAEAMKATTTPAARPPAPVVAAGSDDSNVGPASMDDLPAVWRALLQRLAAQSGLHGVMSNGRLTGFEDGQAVIRFGPQYETFVRAWDRNGKRDVIRDALTQVVNQGVGVRFEVDPAADDDNAGEPPPAVAAPDPPATRPTRPDRPRAAQPAAPPPPAAAPVRLTPEMVEELRKVPLVKALMDELGAAPMSMKDE
jgi:DNA polymerase-3 subunit gamma/tau